MAGAREDAEGPLDTKGVWQGSALPLIASIAARPAQVVGTYVMQVVFMLAAASATHMAAARGGPRLVGLLLLGSLPGVWLGSCLTVRVPQRLMGGALAMMILAVGVRLL